MGCLFAIFAGLFPRLGVLLIWLARPILFTAAFGGFWLWPILGIIFLPFTTLIYVLLWTPGHRHRSIRLAVAAVGRADRHRWLGEHRLCQP